MMRVVSQLLTPPSLANVQAARTPTNDGPALPLPAAVQTSPAPFAVSRAQILLYSIIMLIGSWTQLVVVVSSSAKSVKAGQVDTTWDFNVVVVRHVVVPLGREQVARPYQSDDGISPTDCSTKLRTLSAKILPQSAGPLSIIRLGLGL